MMAKLIKLRQAIVNGLRYFLTFLIYTLILVGFVQVVLRKFANESIPDADLLLTMLVYYIALFGACLATYKDKHITIEIVSNFVSESTNNKLRLLSNIFSIWIMIILFFAAQDYIALQEGSLDMFMSFVPTYLVESAIIPAFAIIIFGFFLNSMILLSSFFNSESANG